MRSGMPSSVPSGRPFRRVAPAPMSKERVAVGVAAIDLDAAGGVDNPVLSDCPGLPRICHRPSRRVTPNPTTGCIGGCDVRVTYPERRYPLATSGRGPGILMNRDEPQRTIVPYRMSSSLIDRYRATATLTTAPSLNMWIGVPVIYGQPATPPSATLSPKTPRPTLRTVTRTRFPWTTW